MPTHRHHLACNDSAPRLARAWVTEHLHDLVTADTRWRANITADAVLCVSELVTASLIANSTAMTLHIDTGPDAFRLSLVDDCPVTTDEGDARLRAQLIGFRVIDALADGWGIKPAPGGREVWTEFRSKGPGSGLIGA